MLKGWSRWRRLASRANTSPKIHEASGRQLLGFTGLISSGRDNNFGASRGLRIKVTFLGLGVVVLITWVLFWGWATEIIRTWFPFMQFDRSLADLCFDR